MGRAPFDSKYRAVWRAMFESFAPVERALPPVYRLLLRSRGVRLRGVAVPDAQSAHKVASDTASQAIEAGVSLAEPERVLRAYVEAIPLHVDGTIPERVELLGENRQLHPYVVIAGMGSAMVTRASYGARLNWFQILDWSKVSCMLGGLLPNVQDDKKFPMDTRRGFGKIAQHEAFDALHAHLPPQPDDKSRVWGSTRSQCCRCSGAGSVKMWPSSAASVYRYRPAGKKVPARGCG